MFVVTGGAGFIGSNLVQALEERGHFDTAVIDRLGLENKWRNLAKRELETIIDPSNTFSFLDKNVSRISTIFHMGAISSTTEKDADVIIENNLHLSQELWRWCAKSDKRLIYASSAATYGSGAAGFVDEQSPEFLKTLNPLNAYGWSKHLFDQWVSRQNERNDPKPSQCVGLKFFNVYGPNEYHKGGQQSVIVQIYETLKHAETVKLFKSNSPDYKDGEQLRDFIYVKDCVNVMLWFLDHPQVQGLFNVGTGVARTFNDLVAAAYEAMKMKKISNTTYVTMPESLSPNYQNFTESNNKKIRQHGYTNEFYTLEDGVRDYIQNYLIKNDKYL